MFPNRCWRWDEVTFQGERRDQAGSTFARFYIQTAKLIVINTISRQLACNGTLPHP